MLGSKNAHLFQTLKIHTPSARSINALWTLQRTKEGKSSDTVMGASAVLSPGVTVNRPQLRLSPFLVGWWVHLLMHPWPLPRTVCKPQGESARVVRAQRSAPARSRGRHQHLAALKAADSAAQPRTVGMRAARGFPKHFVGSGGAQLLHSRVNALTVCRNSGVAVNYALLMGVISAQGKRFGIKALSFEGKS